LELVTTPEKNRDMMKNPEGKKEPYSDGDINESPINYPLKYAWT